MLCLRVPIRGSIDDDYLASNSCSGGEERTARLSPMYCSQAYSGNNTVSLEIATRSQRKFPARDLHPRVPLPLFVALLDSSFSISHSHTE